MKMSSIIYGMGRSEARRAVVVRLLGDGDCNTLIDCCANTSCVFD